MSSPLVAQQDAEILPNDPNDGVQQGVDRVEAQAAGSDNEELTLASISARLDHLTKIITLAVRLLVHIDGRITQIDGRVTQMDGRITPMNENITQMDGKINKNSSDIGHIIRATGEIAKLMLVRDKLIKRNDANTRARINNSHAKSPTDKLRPLLNTALVACEKFPATLAELDELDDESVVDLLGQLGLASDGNAHPEKNRLRDDIGILAF